MQIPILAFHKVDDRFEWGLTRLTPKRFLMILHFLLDHGYESVSLRDAIGSGERLPMKPVVLSFDDGYQDILMNALPSMNRLGFRGSIFIITGYIGKVNSWDVNLGRRMFQHLNEDQIRMLHGMGWEIGSHTVCHSDLTRLSQDDLNRELLDSKIRLELILQDPVQFVSFPFGRYNSRVIDAARKAGYLGACTLSRRIFSGNKDEMFVLERKAYYLLDGKRSLQAKLGNFGKSLESGKLRLINWFSMGTSLVKPYRPETQD